MGRLFKIMTALDIIVIIAVIILSIVILFMPFWRNNDSQNENKFVYISLNGEVVEKIAVEDTIDNPIIVKVDGPIGKSIIEVYNGKARMKKAPEDDPEKICEKTGWIEKTGPSIICVPNKISIWIESENNELDGVSW